jgi:hypothetical protein
MKTNGTLLVLLSVGLLTGCADRPSEPSGSSHVTTASTAPAHALSPATSASDVAPSRLFTRSGISVIAGAAWSSQPMNPRDSIGDTYAPVETVHTESFQVLPSGSKGTYKVAVDSTDGESALFLSPQVAGHDAIEAVAANIDVLDPNGAKINVRQQKSADDTGGKPMTMIPLSGHPAGIYTVSFHQASTAGVAVEGSFHSSSIVMTLKPSALQHLLGNEEYVDAKLTEAGVPILGAHLTSQLVHGETLANVAPVTFTELGGGVYRAAMHPSFNEGSSVSAYLTDVVAEGVSPKGVAFARHGRTGFHFGIPTARVSDVLAQRTVTDAQGMISGFEVDVKVESTTLDRLEISAKLTAVGSDGAEHPISVAHYGDAIGAGTQVVTLRFDAGDARMTHMQGDFMLRDLQIFSLGTNTLVSREAAAHNRVFPSIARAQLVKHATFSPSQLELVQEGVLYDD